MLNTTTQVFHRTPMTVVCIANTSKTQWREGVDSLATFEHNVWEWDCCYLQSPIVECGINLKWSKIHFICTRLWVYNSNQLLRITLPQGYWRLRVGVKSRSSLMRLYSSSFLFVFTTCSSTSSDIPEWQSDLGECVTHVQQVICHQKWRNQTRSLWVQLLSFISYKIPFRFPLEKTFMKAKGMSFLLKVPGGANWTSSSSPFMGLIFHLS